MRRLFFSGAAHCTKNTSERLTMSQAITAVSLEKQAFIPARSVAEYAVRGVSMAQGLLSLSLSLSLSLNSSK